MPAFTSAQSKRFYRISSGNPAPHISGMEIFKILEKLFHGQEFRYEQKRSGIHNDLCVEYIHEGSSSRIHLQLPESRPGKEELVEIEAIFSNSLDVPTPFRGRKVATKVAAARHSISRCANEEVLAASNFGPIWTLSRTHNGKEFRSALPLPGILAEQNLSDVFNGERFLETLPLLHFLRQSDESFGYRPPPLRAAFIVDDPNLHWWKYGCVDYREVALHAQKENYHVAFATIPLDAWFTHQPTAALFRRDSRLSLLVHGNNHAKHELAKDYSPIERHNILRQALWRIRQLEMKENLQVCRVMVPPHGACSAETLAALPSHGFESACISAGSLRFFNPEKPWTKTLGYFPSESVEGCPVLPRWGLTGNVENTLLTAAYLGRPMILRGHHGDLRNGPELFDQYARFINGLGVVQWSKLSDLSRMNYLWRMEGRTLRIKPLGVVHTLLPPAGATDISIAASGASDENTWQVDREDGTTQISSPEERIPLSDKPYQTILIRRIIAPPHMPSSEKFQRTSPHLIFRRMLAEARDRIFAQMA